jgi:flagellar hook assembly protein FlgD
VRTRLLALVALALATAGTFVPAVAPAAHAASGPKVAIIVGATHGTTSTYRTYANQVYAEAIRYTSNVVRVYSPNATWAAVKSAVNGASIIVYMGHGNGWPSPYTYDPNYTTKDGFGLNATAGAGDYNNKYYGEPSIRTLTPAPNAVVLLEHLCYASGNSEPGDADPSLTVARQRVDNYAAAFLRTNAKAVIADGHVWDHAYYIRALFTTHQTIDQVFRNAPNSNDHYVTYPSSRNPGLTYTMDPDSPGKGFYRSLTGKTTVTTQQITGAGYAATDTDPASFVAPGAASVAVDGASVYADAASATAGGEPTATLPLDTKVRVDGIGANGPDGKPLITMHTLEGSTNGVMLGSALKPRDSQGPRTWDVDDGTGAFSPNGDGSQDTYHLEVALSESAAWTLRVQTSGGSTLRTVNGSGATATLDWDGRKSTGEVVGDGTFTWALSAADAWGNPVLEDEGTFAVDTVAPSLADGGLTPALAGDDILTFSPNGDGYRDTVSVGVHASEPAMLEISMRDGGNADVADLDTSAPSGSATVTWNGQLTNGSVAADGVYQFRVTARDAAGNRSAPATKPIGVHKALVGSRVSSPNFWPNDGDAYAKTITLAFDLLATQTVTWQVLDAQGDVVRTIAQDQAMAAGRHTYSWDGKSETGAYLPKGTYRSVVTATNGTLTTTHAASFVQDLFRISVSDTTPYRGQAITVTVISAEPLSKLPRITVSQPGVSAWSVTMSHVSGRTYKVTLRLKSGSTGTVTLRASGYDAASAYGSSTLALPLH